MCPPRGSAWPAGAGWRVASLMQLVWRHPLAAVAARAIAVPGALFTAICLATGSIWGRPTWGTWWEWDGRLTSMLVLFFLYVAYIALAGASSRARRIEPGGGDLRAGRRGQPADHPLFGAVVAHAASGAEHHADQGSTIDGSILWPLPVALLGFTLLFAAIVLMRMRALLAQGKVEARLKRMARRMNHWPFIIAAYAIAIGGTVGADACGASPRCAAPKARRAEAR